MPLATLTRPTTAEAVREAIARLNLRTTPEIGRFIAREIELDTQRIAASERELGRQRGVCWGGMGAEPYQPRTAAQIAEAASDKAVRDADFWQSPRGVFVRAINNIAKTGAYTAEAERARAAYNRGFADATQPAGSSEVGCALLALNEVPGRDGIRARAALAELLLGRRSVAA